MNESLKPGISNQSSMVVKEEHTASYLGSGSLQVLATPALVAFMENVSMKLVAPFLNDAQSTVGVELSVKHLKASNVGSLINCEAVLTDIKDRKLFFSVKAFENNMEIGNCTHTRFIVDSEVFMSKLSKR
jgi:fluoroacetyl-CoA thioesterase